MPRLVGMSTENIDDGLKDLSSKAPQISYIYLDPAKWYTILFILELSREYKRLYVYRILPPFAGLLRIMRRFINRNYPLIISSHHLGQKLRCQTTLHSSLFF